MNFHCRKLNSLVSVHPPTTARPGVRFTVRPCAFLATNVRSRVVLMWRAICWMASSQEMSSQRSAPGRRTLGERIRFGLSMSYLSVAPFGQSVPRLVGASGSPSTCTTVGLTFFALSPKVWTITPHATAQNKRGMELILARGLLIEPATTHKGRPMLARISCALSLLSLGSAAAAPRTFMIDSSASSVRLHVGKTGLVSFAGHEHEVVARSVEGEVDADFEDLSRSAVEVVVDASSLTVRAEGEPEGDPPQIEQAMKGRQVLDAKRFPDIRFRSQQVTAKGLSPGSYQLTVAGDLLLHGAVQPIVVPIRIDLMDDVLTGTGKFVLKQTDFGIEPTTAAAGPVKVVDEETVTFRI